MNDDVGGCPGLRRMRSPRMGLMVIIAGAALLTAACGGGSGATREVASLGTSSGHGGANTAVGGGGGGSSATAAPKGNPSQLLDQWAACMRSHGDPTQADPTIDVSKVIHITMPAGFPGGLFGQNGHGTGPGVHCASYLGAAQTALQAGYSPPKAPSQAALLKYAECMRANGVPDFPDPVGGSLQFNRATLPPGELTSPAFQEAVKVCAQQTGVHLSGPGGTPPPGTIESNVGMLAPVPGGNGGSGANG
jgi:hypothetical protein